MINTVWFVLMFTGLVVSALTGRAEEITGAVFASAEKAVAVGISLLSIMTFWFGMMKVVEESGLLDRMFRLLRPLARFLFPRLPDEHPVTRSILMNMSANVLGMGSAATPFGLKAMQELQELNKDKETASDEMCTFLLVNTSSVTLVPMTVVALRAASGSLNPAEIIGTTIIATCCSTIVAIVLDRVFRPFSR
ncbi:MAG: Spore maturation protein A [Syntrophomonadaceae bacterium]|nr:Spore maturation protein A [Bacillota bacterium]